MSDYVITQRANRIATITINRPDAQNTVIPELVLELRDAFEDCTSDKDIRCVILTSNGGTFMAGADVKFFHRTLKEEGSDGKPPKPILTLLTYAHEIIQCIHNAPQPIIAKVEGWTAGYGLSLMLSCDLAIVADNAMFTTAFSRLGTNPDGGCTYHLPRIVGMRKALELTLLNEHFDAQTALDMGLVNKVVPSAKLDEVTDALAVKLASGSSSTISKTKQLIHKSFNSSLSLQLNAEGESFKELMVTDDFAEGVSAFVQKREPQFS